MCNTVFSSSKWQQVYAMGETVEQVSHRMLFFLPMNSDFISAAALHLRAFEVMPLLKQSHDTYNTAQEYAAC